MNKSIETYVIYSLVGIFVDTDDNGLTDWTDAHVAQGFSWSPRSVSFGTFSDNGPLSVEIEITSELNLRESARRVIQVPFNVDVESVAISNAVDFFEFALPLGKYQLTYQHGWNDEETVSQGRVMWCVLSLVLCDDAGPKILSADSQIEIPTAFLMDAKLA